MKLIEADKALKIAESYGTTHGTSLGRHSGIADTIYDEIAKLPTIEAEPARHGEWVYGEYDIPHCSECGKEPKEISPFCPHCGAKMDGGEVNDA